MRRGEILPEPFIAPVADGRIQVEWEIDDKELEITVDHDGAIEYLYVKRIGDEFLECHEGSITVSDLADLLFRSVHFLKGS